ncbi:hypothetical protein HMPREF9446_03226 [Bacteroides fluxus YIT 12057]|uniref:Uncharacterized protein n=1 Tax=Bacteroides fluxus YIT 12057 TaxID=763034 RepID=F3PWT9_9BACE|nr:hypothetical protein HMPREF9446_03226 [Bacteroides fluxus YIT 12057]
MRGRFSLEIGIHEKGRPSGLPFSLTQLKNLHYNIMEITDCFISLLNKILQIVL